MLGILYRRWRRRSGRIVVPEDFFVGQVSLRRKEFDPVTGKLIQEGFEDLGSNLIVDAGRKSVIRLLTSESIGFGRIGYAKWSDGTDEADSEDTSVGGTAHQVRPASITGTVTGSGDTHTFDLSSNNVLAGMVGSSSFSLSFSSGSAVPLATIVSNINSIPNIGAVEGSGSDAGKLILFNNARSGTNSIQITTSTTNSAHEVFGFNGTSVDGSDRKIITPGSVPDDGSTGGATTASDDLAAVFQVELRSGDDAYEADIWQTSTTPDISDIGIWMNPTDSDPDTEDQRFFARKVFGNQTKTTAVSLDFTWTVDARRQES